MKWWTVIFLVLALLACRAPAQRQSEDSNPRIAQSSTCTISIPDDWNSITDATGRSVISVGNLVKNQFLSITVVARADFDGSLSDFLDQAVGDIAPHTDNYSASQPVSTEIAGIPAVQIRITGGQNRFKMIYCLTVTESKGYFYRILTFTRPSSEQAAGEVFAKVLATFRPIDPAS